MTLVRLHVDLCVFNPCPADAAGAGACVLSETFPGLEWMYPPHAVARLPLSPWKNWAPKAGPRAHLLLSQIITPDSDRGTAARQRLRTNGLSCC